MCKHTIKHNSIYIQISKTIYILNDCNIHCYTAMHSWTCVSVQLNLSTWCSITSFDVQKQATWNQKLCNTFITLDISSSDLTWYVYHKLITLTPSASDNWSSKASLPVVKDCLPVLNLLRCEVLKVLHVISMLVKVVVQTPVLLEVILQLVLHVLQERQIPAATSLPFTSNSWSKPGMSLSRWPLACRSSMSQPRASRQGTSRRRGRSMVTGPDRGMYFGKQIFQLGS